jgi:hypothetical protein
MKSILEARFGTTLSLICMRPQQPLHNAARFINPKQNGPGATPVQDGHWNFVSLQCLFPANLNVKNEDVMKYLKVKVPFKWNTCIICHFLLLWFQLSRSTEKIDNREDVVRFVLDPLPPPRDKMFLFPRPPEFSGYITNCTYVHWTGGGGRWRDL